MQLRLMTELRDLEKLMLEVIKQGKVTAEKTWSFATGRRLVFSFSLRLNPYGRWTNRSTG